MPDPIILKQLAKEIIMRYIYAFLVASGVYLLSHNLIVWKTPPVMGYSIAVSIILAVLMGILSFRKMAE